jgi:predicted RNase H-like nuclease
VQTMSTLLVGFDSAWTPAMMGAIVGVLRLDDGTYRELGIPAPATYADAERILLKWQADLSPSMTIILLDQPTIVRNASGQRPVENIVASPVSLRFGGVQPANTFRAGDVRHRGSCVGLPVSLRRRTGFSHAGR